MPKNLTGGKHHRGKKNKQVVPQDDVKIEYAGEDQFYACVKKKVGGQRLIVTCSDDKERSAFIPGKFFKRVWMNVGDIVLCNANTDGTDENCYIVYKYNNREASTLKSQGNIKFDVTQEKEDQTYEIPEENDLDWEDSDEEKIKKSNKKNESNKMQQQRVLDLPDSDESSESISLDDL